MDDIPILKIELVPSEGLPRNGIGKNIFIGLWSTISSLDTKLYRKNDWSKLDEIIFKQSRTRKDKEDLIRIVSQQWALAKELSGYQESSWQGLYNLIQKKYK